MLPYYLALARQSFRAAFAYRAATLAGMLTNAFFGVLYASTLIALFRYRTQVAGYTLQRMLQYTWLMQALIGVIALWGWWEIALTIRSGDIVSDLARPADYYLSWLSRDLGRALYQLLFRGLPMIAAGLLFYGAPLPALLALPALSISLVLAVLISFAWRFALNLTAFWLTDIRGTHLMAVTVISFLSGFVVPIAFFPPLLHTVAAWLPFQAMITVPGDIYTGRAVGVQAAHALLAQCAWAAVLSAGCYVLLARARRRLEVQGG